MKLALTVDMDTAAAVAARPEDDEVLQRKLWLLIARHLITSSADASGGNPVGPPKPISEMQFGVAVSYSIQQVHGSKPVHPCCLFFCLLTSSCPQQKEERGITMRSDSSFAASKSRSPVTLCGIVVQPSRIICAAKHICVYFPASPPPPHSTPSGVCPIFGSHGCRYMNEDHQISPARRG
jgi:hypothetical protein